MLTSFLLAIISSCIMNSHQVIITVVILLPLPAPRSPLSSMLYPLHSHSRSEEGQPSPPVVPLLSDAYLSERVKLIGTNAMRVDKVHSSLLSSLSYLSYLFSLISRQIDIITVSLISLSLLSSLFSILFALLSFLSSIPSKHSLINLRGTLLPLNTPTPFTFVPSTNKATDVP